MDENNNNDELLKEIFGTTLTSGTKLQVAQMIYANLLAHDPQKLMESSADDFMSLSKKAWQAAEIFSLVSEQNSKETSQRMTDIIKRITSQRPPDDYNQGF